MFEDGRDASVNQKQTVLAKQFSSRFVKKVTKRFQFSPVAAA